MEEYDASYLDELRELFKNAKTEIRYRWENISGRYNQSWNTLKTVDLVDKYQRGVGFNGSEQSEFSGICSLGDSSLIECYGKYGTEGTQLSAYDICVLCSKFEHFNKPVTKALRFSNIDPSLDSSERYDPARYSIARPDFIVDAFSDAIDYREQNAYVYFITDGHYIKIGKAKSIKKRLDSMQVGNAKELKIMYAIPTNTERGATAIEGFLHNTYCNYRTRGEWYNIKWLIDTKAWENAFSVTRTDEFYEDSEEGKEVRTWR